MSRLLHVSASPLNSSSYSGQVAASFVESWRVAHTDSVVDELNVWAEDLPLFDALGASWKTKVMTGQTPSRDEVEAVGEVTALCERFLAADHYLFSVPMWNFSIPYRLKHYIDALVQPGLTFGFDPASGGYVGLCPPDRPVLLVLARGSTAYGPDEAFGTLEHQESYLRGILGFIGLTDVRSITVECTAYPAEVSAPLLESARERAAQVAPDF